MTRLTKYFRIRKPPFLGCMALLFGLAALVCYFFVDFLFLDKIMFYLTYLGPSPLIKWASFLLFPPLYLSLCLGCFLYVRFSKKDLGQAVLFFELLAAQLLSVAFVRVSKIFIGRARPEAFFAKGFFGFEHGSFDSYFHSFPSGHIAAVFTLAASIALCYPRFRILSISLASVFSLSRVLLLAHFPSDLFATGGLVMLIAQIVHVVLKSLHT